MDDSSRTERPWRVIPAFSRLRPEEWGDPAWQEANSVTSVPALRSLLGTIGSDTFWADLQQGREGAAMALRLSPHWVLLMLPDLEGSPLRRFTLPLASERAHPASHPWSAPDRLGEQRCRENPWFLKRYPKTALLLLGRSCPVYCAHCTRCWSVGPSTSSQEKDPADGWTPGRSQALREQILAHPQVWDLLISGGDALHVPLHHLDQALDVALSLPQIQNIRLASRVPIGLPQAVLRGGLLSLLERRAAQARARGVSLVLHTQLNHPDELSPDSVAAFRALRSAGVEALRNQAVLLRGVNDTLPLQRELHERAWRSCRLEPYCVYLCELIPGTEHLRTTVEHALELERGLVGSIPGFCQPRFLVDLPGIGKRPISTRAQQLPDWGLHRWSGIDRESSRSVEVWHPDPAHLLSPEGMRFWTMDPQERERSFDARLREAQP